MMLDPRLFISYLNFTFIWPLMFGLIPKQDIHRYSYPQMFSETTLNSMNRLDPRKDSTQNVHLMELRGSEIDFPGSFCTLSDEKQLRNINIDPSDLKEKYLE